MNTLVVPPSLDVAAAWDDEEVVAVPPLLTLSGRCHAQPMALWLTPGVFSSRPVADEEDSVRRSITACASATALLP